ncbi:hypothetical protein L950_0201910 [Sphingobacterium sp. IITKGP-BTPF85]|nr:hypothetical protein L950_0201910 [Sphingobacterium sp. IITKGP-BTPF85]
MNLLDGKLVSAKIKEDIKKDTADLQRKLDVNLI